MQVTGVVILFVLAFTAGARGNDLGSCPGPHATSLPGAVDPVLLQTSTRGKLKRPAGQALDGSNDINGDPCEPQYCMAYGDPHMVTFDGKTAVFTQEKLFWLVKSQDVQIQAYSGANNGRLTKLVAGGPFLKDNTLEVSGFGTLDVTWNGEPILAEKDDEYLQPGLVDLQRLSTSLATAEHMKDLPDHEAIEAAFEEAKGWADMTGGRDASAGIFNAGHLHLKLPEGVEIFVAPKFEVLIRMPKCKVPQGGWCENFNGDPDDDLTSATTQEEVSDDASLFPSLTQNITQGKAAGKRKGKGKRKVARVAAKQDCPADCPSGCEKAKDDCKHLLEGSFHESCLYDVCHGADALETMVAEVMETEEARGIPKFVGHGKCVDGNGAEYTTFEDADVTDEEGCRAALAMSAEAEGVWGAQLKAGGACQFLVAATHVPLGSLTKVSDGTGAAMVSSVAEEAGYSCWKLA